MKLFSRIALVAVVAATPVVLTAQPASACFGTRCLVECVVDLATEQTCKL